MQAAKPGRWCRLPGRFRRFTFGNKSASTESVITRYHDMDTFLATLYKIEDCTIKPYAVWFLYAQAFYPLLFFTNSYPVPVRDDVRMKLVKEHFTILFLSVLCMELGGAEMQMGMANGEWAMPMGAFHSFTWMHQGPHHAAA